MTADGEGPLIIPTRGYLVTGTEKGCPRSSTENTPSGAWCKVFARIWMEGFEDLRPKMDGR